MFDRLAKSLFAASKKARKMRVTMTQWVSCMQNVFVLHRRLFKKFPVYPSELQSLNSLLLPKLHATRICQIFILGNIVGTCVFTIPWTKSTTEKIPALAMDKIGFQSAKTFQSDYHKKDTKTPFIKIKRRRSGNIPWEFNRLHPIWTVSDHGRLFSELVAEKNCKNGNHLTTEGNRSQLFVYAVHEKKIPMLDTWLKLFHYKELLEKELAQQCTESKHLFCFSVYPKIWEQCPRISVATKLAHLPKVDMGILKLASAQVMEKVFGCTAALLHPNQSLKIAMKMRKCRFLMFLVDHEEDLQRPLAKTTNARFLCNKPNSIKN